MDTGENKKQPQASLPSHQTLLSFQRTKLSTEHTLMSVIRTSLALIGFGFTLVQVFHFISKNYPTLSHSEAPRIFGFSLAILGNLLLIMGIIEYIKFNRQIIIERNSILEDHTLHLKDKFKPASILMVAVLLLILSILAIITMIIQIKLKHTIL